MADYYQDNAAAVLAQIGAHHDADPAPLADTARDHHGDMNAGAIIGMDGAILAHTIRDNRGTYRVHKPLHQAFAWDIYAARHLRHHGPTVHVPLWRIFAGHSGP
ncbi:hypothetical protein ACSBQY_06720 [Micrococcus lylae]|uniref:hypothetical protein n=1 Tax=Micrococcus lylae TaxID=1273 RepID=UPI003EBBDB58